MAYKLIKERILEWYDQLSVIQYILSSEISISAACDPVLQNNSENSQAPLD